MLPRPHSVRESLRRLIRHYTREAGVRNLEREIGSVIRERDFVTDLLRKQRQISFTTADDVLNPPEQVEELRLQASV